LQQHLTNPCSKVNFIAFKEDGRKKQEHSAAAEEHPFADDAEKSIVLGKKSLAGAQQAGSRP
jgi:hypothetical protein